MASPATTLGPVPEPPAPGGGPPTGRSGAEALLGQESQRRDRESSNRGFVSIIRTIHEQLEDLARQFPAFGPFGKRAQDAIKEGMVRTLQGEAGPEESGLSIPRVVG